ncbi:MAG TPA: hypothetical protein VFH43_04845, partial [Candidatus Kapabacteria bacterium]|nr:hypothetical protein [Candidatus Kapabacteria bacterium]
MYRILFFISGLIVAIFTYLTVTGSVRGDDLMHYLWMEDYARLVELGVFPPRWTPWISGGLGSPAFYL